MDGLPSKSISKPILLAIPLFCLVLAILGASDELSYLFVLEFLDNMAGTPDITFLPSQQPEIGQDYQKQQFFNYQGLNLMDSNNNATQIPLVSKQVIEEWANTTNTIRGVSPRWLVPVVVNRTDSLLLVTDVQRELKMGLGLKSHLQVLGEREVALSGDLLGKSGKRVGEQMEIELSIKDLFNGRKLVEKYQSLASEDEDGLISKR